MSPEDDRRPHFETSIEGVAGRWPEVPDRFSYSSLAEIEACPRRWALSRASFPSVWDGPGHPAAPNIAALRGHVVHGALEELIGALVDAGCESAGAADATAVLRGVGGYTAVIRRRVDSVLEAHQANPRFVARQAELTRQLVSAVPQMRQAVQSLLARTRFKFAAGGERRGSTGPTWGGPEGAARTSGGLPDGSYPEMWVQSSTLRMAGKADLVTLDGSSVEILDYKTGEPRPHHSDQVRLYALIWAHQDVGQADRPRASRLTLAYPSHEVDVPAPGVDELDAMTESVRARIASAEQELGAVPIARPSEETCSFCSVRQLCDEYWTWLRQEDVSPGYIDLEVQLSEPNGPRSWIGRGHGEEWAIVGFAQDSTERWKTGEVIRILGLSVPQQDEASEFRLASLTSSSEIYRLRS